MTNKEYIVKNNISFSDALKMWDNKTTCIDEWLNMERKSHKFKVGDFIKKSVSDSGSKANTYVGVVVKVDNLVWFRKINRNGTFDVMYNGTTEFFMGDEDTFEKIC